MTAKRTGGHGKGSGKASTPLRTPRGGSAPSTATDDGRGLSEVDRETVPLQDRVSLGQPRLSAVVPGEFGDHADRACREWLDDLDAQMGGRAPVTGRLESAVLLVIGREAVLESVCLPEGACRFRFVGALRLLAHRLERSMVEDD